MNFTPEQKLIVSMLADILKIVDTEKKSNFDADFISSAVLGKYDWAISWEHQSIADPKRTDPPEVTEVVNHLDMWSLIEQAYASLDAADKAWLAKEVPHFGNNPQFSGYDGNNESTHMGTARFLIHKMERFTEFAERDLNSHGPRVDRYNQMYSIFSSIRPQVQFRNLTKEELEQILQA